MAERLAGIWAMVAELDPGLAQRLSQYTDRARNASPCAADGHHVR